jgi:hypothetical protein
MASPSSGSGLQQTFTFTATDSGGSTGNLTGLNALFNSTLDGSHACWMFYDGRSQLWLASDDASAWTATGGNNPTVQNSQCGVTIASDSSYGGSLVVSITVTFTNSFSGTKNIYMHAANGQGGDTGYPIEGTWTVP